MSNYSEVYFGAKEFYCIQARGSKCGRDFPDNPTQVMAVVKAYGSLFQEPLNLY